MSERPDEDSRGISDDQLPEDVRPSEEENPLAQGLPDDADVDPADLDLAAGKEPEQDGEDATEEQSDGASGAGGEKG